MITSSSKLANSENNLKSEDMISNKNDKNNDISNQQSSSKNIDKNILSKSDYKKKDNLEQSHNLEQNETNDKIKEMPLNNNNIKFSNSSS